MPAIQLTPADRKDKRGEAHHLDPVVMIGAEGLTPAVIKETDAALKAHGLIKVRVFSDDRQSREAMLVKLAEDLDAAAVQHIGKLLVLWRPIPEKERTESDGRHAGPRMVKVVTPSKSNRRPTVKLVQVFGNQRVTPGGQIKRTKKRITSAKRKAQARD